MAKNVAGVPANHSSEVTSADAADQSPSYPGQDGNIAATQSTGDTYTWQAGPMNVLQENDDYREFGPGRMDAPASRLDPYGMHDGDYDDNGGVPLAEGESRGSFSHPADHVEPFAAQAIGLNAVIVRRF